MSNLAKTQHQDRLQLLQQARFEIAVFGKMFDNSIARLQTKLAKRAKEKTVAA